MCRFCSPEAFAGVSGLLHRGIWLRRVSCHQPDRLPRDPLGSRCFSKHGRETRAGGEAVRHGEGMPASLPCPTPRPVLVPANLALSPGSPAKPGQFGAGGDEPCPCSRWQHALARTGTGRLLGGAAARAAAWAPQPFPKLSKLKKKKPKPRMSEFSSNSVRNLTGQK